MMTMLGDTVRRRAAVLAGSLGVTLVLGSLALDGTAAIAAPSAEPVTTSAAALAAYPAGVAGLSAIPTVDGVEPDAVTITWRTAVAPASDPSSTLVVVVLPADAAEVAAPIVALQPSAPNDPAADAAALASGLPVLATTDGTSPDAETSRARIAGLSAETSYRFALRTLPADEATLAAATAPFAESAAVTGTTAAPAAVEDPAPAPPTEAEAPVSAPEDEAAQPPADLEPATDPAPTTAPSPEPSTSPDAGAPAVPSVPGTPEAPKGTPAGDGTIEVTWPAVATGAAVVSYTVTAYRGDAAVRSVSGIDPLVAGTTALVGGLLANTAYTFTVTAVGTDGHGDPSPRSAAVTTAKGAPTAPTRPTLTALHSDPLGLVASWTAPSSDGGYSLTGYTVELFSGSTVNLTNLLSRTEVPASRTSIELPRIGIVGSALSVRVTASNGGGEASSSLSAAYRIDPTAQVTTRVGTPSVAEVPASAGQDDAAGLLLSWTAPTGTTADTGYLVRIATVDGVSVALTAAVVDLGTDFARTGALTAQVQNPAPGRTVSVQITAYEPASLAGLIEVAYRTTSLRSTGIETSGSSAPQRPDRPTGVTSGNVDRITVSGTTIAAIASNGAPITAFDLVVSRAGAAEVVTTKRVAAVAVDGDPSRLTHAPATITGLSKDTGYTVRAAAVNAAGAGPLSAPSTIVTTLATAPAGSVPPSWASLAALRAAVQAKTVTAVDAADAALEASVEPTSALDPTFVWPGSAKAVGGEVWLFGSATDDRAPVYLGQFSIADGTASASVALGELIDGDYALAFVPTAGSAAAIEFAVAAQHGGPAVVDDAVLRWGFSNEANNGAFFGGCNFLTAGHVPDVGSGTIIDESRYSAQSDAVSIQKPNAAGTYELASYATRCLDRTGSTVDSNVASSFTDSQLVIVGGTGTVDPSTNSGTISWTGDFSVAFYGGLTYWYGSDPKLTVENGIGTLTATASGFGTDMADQTKWTQIAPREIVLATLVGVTMRSDGFTVSPSYVGVKISQSDQVAPNSSNASYWGSFPQSFIDFQALTGQFSYWFTSGGRQDPGKVALPLTVGFDASTFVAVAPAGASAADAVDLVPNAKRSPFALKVPGAPAAVAAGGVGQQVTQIITLVQPAVAPIPAGQVVPLFIMLLALLGGLTVVAAAGGGLIAAGVLKP